MPWQLELRDGDWCVVREDGEVVSGGNHLLRVDAVKHQRALYANESRVASMYSELDALPEPEVEVEVEPEVVEQPVVASSRMVRIEIPTDEALTASVMQQMERMQERQSRTDQALVAALEMIGSRDPVVNVHQAPITVEQPSITVESPTVNVEAPTVTVEAPAVTVEAPAVTVMPEFVLPERQKTVTFERDPLTHELTRADIVES